MKIRIIILIFLVPLIGFSQNKIHLEYGYTDNTENEVVNTLNNIITRSLICKDKKAQGKKFLIRRETYLKGKMIASDSIISCKNRNFSVISGQDTLYYKTNLCDRTIFLKKQEDYKIIFAGKFKGDSISTRIRYPSMGTGSTLKANKKFDFHPLQKTDEDSGFEITEGVEYPIIALTSPVPGQNGLSSYCLIDSQRPKNFYKAFDIKRYYLYYLTIK